MSQEKRPRPGASFFLEPSSPVHRRYEALRAYLVDGLSADDVGDQFGYSGLTLYTLAKELRAGRLSFFHEPKRGPKSAPKRDAVTQRVVELRKLNYSVQDIERIVTAEGKSISHTLASRILREEGFAKLPRRTRAERPPLVRPDVAEVADIRELDWSKLRGFETEAGGLFVFIPMLLDWGLARWVRKAGLPGTSMIPALQSVLSLLSLKLVGKERISHVMDVCLDPGFALFAGMNAVPKTWALSTYSYRVTRHMTESLLRSYVESITGSGLLPGQSFNLDFHAIPVRGEEAEVEKHYISRRSRRERAILVFLVQDNDTRALCYANATVRKDAAADEILRFVEFWKTTRGANPPHLVFDSQLTTYEVMSRLDRDGILFVTLRRRGTNILRGLADLPSSQWNKTRLSGVSRRYRDVTYHESLVPIRAFDASLRQIAARGLGHEEPTLLLTNDAEIKARDLIERYARRMIIENTIAENIDFFHLDALSSAIALQVDLDVMLTLISNALYRQLALRLVGHERAQPKQIFRRFLNTPARVTVTDDAVVVRMRRLAHHPILLSCGALEPSPAVPWWEGRRLRLEIR